MGLHEILLEVFVTEIVIYKFLFLYTNLKDTGALNVHLNYKKKRKEAQICIFFSLVISALPKEVSIPHPLFGVQECCSLLMCFLKLCLETAVY